MEFLSQEEKIRQYGLEVLADIGKEIHFSAGLCDGTFLLLKPCHHRGGNFTHEFGIYHSRCDGNIYFHRCDHCTYSVRITESDYNRAKQIHDMGGTYID